MDNKLTCLIMAAGKGTRMKSDLAKVLHELAARPMIHHVLEAVADLAADETIVVIGHQHEKVRAALAGHRVSFVLQKEQLGTAHAVLCAKERLAQNNGTVLILCGDIPLIRPTTLREMLAHHRAKAPALTVMTTRLSDPTGYGRVLCDRQGSLLKIVEERDASPEERKTKTINAGIYCAATPFLLAALQRVKSDNLQNEMYLTDIVAIANRMGQKVQTYTAVDSLEVLGVNSIADLELAEKTLANRRLHDTSPSPATTADTAQLSSR